MRFILCTSVMLCTAFLLFAQEAGRGGPPAATAPRAMTLAIPGFPDGGKIPVKFSQAAAGVAPGEGTSPAMTWAGVPAGTQSFFLHMHDLDLARNKTTDDQAHWVLWNIPQPRRACRKAYPRGRNCPTAAFKSAPQVPCTADREPPQTAPFTTMSLNSTPSIPSWM